MEIYKRTAERKSGTEGPAYDPYHYEEFHINVNDKEIVLHLGLGEWMTVNNERVWAKMQGDVVLNEKLEELTGMTLHNLEQLLNRKENPTHCHDCGRRLTWKSVGSMGGMYGESFDICIKCKAIVGYHFDESAIM